MPPHLLLHEVSNFFCLSIPVAQSARRSSVALYRNNKVSSDKRPSFCLHSEIVILFFKGQRKMKDSRLGSLMNNGTG